MRNYDFLDEDSAKSELAEADARIRDLEEQAPASPQDIPGGMTPQEFERRMGEIITTHYDSDNDDVIVAHVEADKLLCEALKSLGFAAGIAAYEGMELYYS